MSAQKRTRIDGKMPKGLAVEDLQAGAGPAARRGNIVDVRFAIHLSRVSWSRKAYSADLFSAPAGSFLDLSVE